MATSPARMQVVPTGPVLPGESYRRVLLGAVQSARRRLIITTPYFVPDDPTLVALMMAADRGVKVDLILPQTPDQFFSAAAGRAHYARLLEAGIAIHLYQPGLIHSKTTTVDETLALFGSANLDVRSFNLNFELSRPCIRSRRHRPPAGDSVGLHRPLQAASTSTSGASGTWFCNIRIRRFRYFRRCCEPSLVIVSQRRVTRWQAGWTGPPACGEWPGPLVTIVICPGSLIIISGRSR